MIRAIIFDCFGVLTTDLWHEFLQSVPASTNMAELHALLRALDNGILSWDEFEAEVYARTGQNPPDVSRLQAGTAVKNEPLLTYIAELSDHYKIGMISNISSDWVRESFLNDNEQALFDDFVLSYDVGLTKPSLGIYELAADRLGVEQGECVFIDDITTYCDAARECGMQAITYLNATQTRRELEAILAADTKK